MCLERPAQLVDHDRHAFPSDTALAYALAVSQTGKGQSNGACGSNGWQRVREKNGRKPTLPPVLLKAISYLGIIGKKG
ncbi:hypothetical protein MPNT_460009 [Candidatus Methylacidithermus pantelleriae]|uniref:Transposase n=1 Tax=Candidatus Methylacidithermus pantelleriae TaxID=2744239 RepID=A0A8J2FT06_9BACT|nr:hypothetical protein MPNT_460009 [Candidatus Methylacidithermus pantelleriae]